MDFWKLELWEDLTWLLGKRAGVAKKKDVSPGKRSATRRLRNWDSRLRLRGLRIKSGDSEREERGERYVYASPAHIYRMRAAKNAVTVIYIRIDLNRLGKRITCGLRVQINGFVE